LDPVKLRDLQTRAAYMIMHVPLADLTADGRSPVIVGSNGGLYLFSKLERPRQPGDPARFVYSLPGTCSEAAEDPELYGRWDELRDTIVSEQLPQMAMEDIFSRRKRIRENRAAPYPSDREAGAHQVA